MSKLETVYSDLLVAAHSFCTTLKLTLMTKHVPDPSIDILTHFSTTPTPVIEEHGHKSLAPFIGRPFIGIDKVEKYFALQAAAIDIEELQFPPLPGPGGRVNGAGIMHHQEIEEEEEEIDKEMADLWLVDTENKMVSVAAMGRFITQQTQQRWETKVCYRLKLVLEQRREVELQEWEIQRVDIWSDTGASK
jgi:hypothetical protein